MRLVVGMLVIITLVILYGITIEQSGIIAMPEQQKSEFTCRQVGHKLAVCRHQTGHCFVASHNGLAEAPREVCGQ